MDEEKPKLPKLKLAERPSSEEERSEDSRRAETTEAEEAERPLELRKSEETREENESLQNVDDMLEDAYGTEKRALRRKNFIRRLKNVILNVSLVLVFFAGTLIYAHHFEEIPILKPTTWYLPFFLSAAFSAWICLQSVRFAKQSYHLLAIFGIFLAGSLVYWNLYVLRYAANDDYKNPSSRLSLSKSVTDFYFTGEFDTLRRIPKSEGIYAPVSPEDYQKAFKATPRDQWRGYFRRHLSAAEMDEVSITNIDEKMRLVSQRIAQARAKNFDQMEAQIQNPEFKLQILQALLRPYTWLIGYL